MEVYILDSLLRRTTVVDVYESLVWTERFSEWGDFELDIRSTPATKKLFTPKTRFTQNNSYRVMTVETVEDSTDAAGKSMLKVKGRSLEYILGNRVAMYDLGGTPWTITAPPKSVMNTIFDHVVRTPAINAGDAIPFLQPGSIFPADTIAAPVDPITWNVEPEDLYSALKKIADPYLLGFRLVRNFDLSQLYFDVYTGSDRTTSQTALPPVVFAPNLDNLQSTTELTTVENAKNVAYVYSDQGALIVYGADADSTTSGLDRDVMPVKADNLPGSPTVDQVTSWLTQVGREALLKNTSYSAFDGEIDQNSQYKYGVHYNLGDLVEMRNNDGVSNRMQVTEQIMVSDSNGERSYPTLTLYQFVNTGSWLSWESNKVWEDYDDDFDTVWGTLP